MESHYRSVLKAVTWRVGGTVVTIGVVLIVTGEPRLAFSIGLVDTVVKIGAFYIHERIWNRLNFGKKEPPEYQI